jgi:hypothetical protein
MNGSQPAGDLPWNTPAKAMKGKNVERSHSNLRLSRHRSCVSAPLKCLSTRYSADWKAAIEENERSPYPYSRVKAVDALLELKTLVIPLSRMDADVNILEHFCNILVSHPRVPPVKFCFWREGEKRIVQTRIPGCYLKGTCQEVDTTYRCSATLTDTHTRTASDAEKLGALPHLWITAI